MAEPKLIVNGREYAVPRLDELTLGELAEAERITGQGYDLTKEGALATLAMVYLACKRVDPRVTLEDIQNLGGDDLEIVGLEDDDSSVPPPPPGDLNEPETTSSDAS